MLIFQGVPPIKGTIKQLLIFHTFRNHPIQSTDLFFSELKVQGIFPRHRNLPAAGVTKASLNGEVDKDYFFGG